LEVISDRSRRDLDTMALVSVEPGGDHSHPFQLTLLRAMLLPAPRRDVFLLKEIQGFTLPEVAKLLGITKEAVRKHLRRAMRQMQHI
jgi:DNA-directed RNA polymerase specialized sigma24 family protein